MLGLVATASTAADPEAVVSAQCAARKLPELSAAAAGPVREDWLVVLAKRRAPVYRGEKPDEIVMTNELIRRTFRLGLSAAALEPPAEYVDAYEAHLAQNLGSGVQACYRGPRLYDTDETKSA
jgi:hypothetical protein